VYSAEGRSFKQVCSRVFEGSKQVVYCCILCIIAPSLRRENITDLLLVTCLLN